MSLSVTVCDVSVDRTLSGPKQDCPHLRTTMSGYPHTRSSTWTLRSDRAKQVPRSSHRCRGTERKQEHSHTQAAAAGHCTGGQESSLSSTMTPEVCIRGRGCGSSVVPMASCMHAWEWLETRETLSRRGASLSRRSVEDSLCPGGGRYLARHVKADESGP